MTHSIMTLRINNNDTLYKSLNIMTFCIMTLSIITLSIMTFRITTLRMAVSLSIHNAKLNTMTLNAERSYA